MFALTGDEDHEVVRVADEPHDRATGAAMLAACPFRAERLVLACEMLVQHGQGDVVGTETGGSAAPGPSPAHADSIAQDGLTETVARMRLVLSSDPGSLDRPSLRYPSLDPLVPPPGVRGNM